MQSALWGLRLTAVAALFFSSATAVEYYLSAHTFCAPGSGCAQVQASVLGKALGRFLPGLGLGVYGFVLLAAAKGDGAVRKVGLWTAMAGGVVAALLLLAQVFIIGHLCWLCVGVDGSGMACAVLAASVHRGDAAAAAAGTRHPHTWWALFVIAVCTPLVWKISSPPTVPDHVRALWHPDKVTVVEISDFECPFCRALHPALAQAVEAEDMEIHTVRISFPLQGHTHARNAARAHVCAQAQQQGDAMAHGLFEAEPPDAAAATRLAEQLGLDQERFTRCVASPETDAHIDANMATVRDSGFSGLPTVWIGSTRLLGFSKKHGAEPYREALRATARGEAPSHRSGAWIALGAVSAIILSLGSLRRRKQR